MNGEVRDTMKPSCHEKMKQIKHEKNRPSPASTAIASDSVVSPLTAAMSSVIILVKIPGARFLLSNQPICLCKNASNSLTLKVNVRFSPPRPKRSFWVYDIPPIKRHKQTNTIVQMSRSFSTLA